MGIELTDGNADAASATKRSETNAIHMRQRDETGGRTALKFAVTSLRPSGKTSVGGDLITFLKVSEGFFLKVLEQVLSEPLLQTVAVEPEEALQSVPDTHKNNTHAVDCRLMLLQRSLLTHICSHTLEQRTCNHANIFITSLSANAVFVPTKK